MMGIDNLLTSKSTLATVLSQFLSKLDRDEQVVAQVKEKREEIRRLACSVVMSYDTHNEEIVIGEDWHRQARGVHSITCTLSGPDCTVVNVIFSEGGLLKPHHHDREESVFVASGSIKETVSGVTIKEGESVTIDANKSHGWVSDGAKLTVVWRPPY